MLKALALDNFWPQGFTKTKSPLAAKKTATNSFRFWLATALIAANAGLLFSYVYGVNQYASKGYEIQDLQNQLTQLNSDNRDISLQVAEAGSMVGIQSDFLASGFVPAGTPIFLKASADALTFNNQ